jgi:hypothetical protein
VTGAKDSQPIEVAYALVLSSRSTIDSVVLDSLGSKFGCAIVVDSVCDGKASKPVADPVGITSPDKNIDTGLNDRR